MLSDRPKRLKKTWEELTAAASTETDPEKLGTILEEILAALEERQRTLSCHKMHLSETGNSDNFAGASPFRAH
jgi:hypothetical protein